MRLCLFEWRYSFATPHASFTWSDPERGALDQRQRSKASLALMGLHDVSIERAIAGGWKYDCECPELAGWTRLKRTRDCGRAGKRVDFDYVAPDGKRFRSLVGARFYSTTGTIGHDRASFTKDRAQRFQDCAVACAACASDEDAPGNDIVICDGACGLAFHQHCLVEPLWAVPEDKWLCPGCVCHQASNPGLADPRQVCYSHACEPSP